MKQQLLKGLNGHGGTRKGAGRPLKIKRKGLPHLARPLIKRTTPIHINWHLKESLKSINIRTKDFFKLFRLAVLKARKKGPKQTKNFLALFKVLRFHFQNWSKIE